MKNPVLQREMAKGYTLGCYICCTTELEPSYRAKWPRRMENSRTNSRITFQLRCKIVLVSQIEGCNNWLNILLLNHWINLQESLYQSHSASPYLSRNGAEIIMYFLVFSIHEWFDSNFSPIWETLAGISRLIESLIWIKQ